MAFSVATLATVIVTIAATVLLVVVLEEGALGALVGSFAGTLLVYCVLLFTRRSDLGLEFSRPLLREMNRFGAPLVPAALALWAISFADRWFIAVLQDQAEVGVYSVAVRVASAVFFISARRSAERGSRSRTRSTTRRRHAAHMHSCSPTSSTSPRGRRRLHPAGAVDRPPADERRELHRAADAVPLLAFSGRRLRGVHGARRVWSARPEADARKLGRRRHRGCAERRPESPLVPPYGMVGAAVATLISYVALLVGMFVYAQTRIQGPVPVATSIELRRVGSRARSSRCRSRPSAGRCPRPRPRLPGALGAARLLSPGGGQAPAQLRSCTALTRPQSGGRSRQASMSKLTTRPPRPERLERDRSARGSAIHRCRPRARRRRRGTPEPGRPRASDYGAARIPGALECHTFGTHGHHDGCAEVEARPARRAYDAMASANKAGSVCVLLHGSFEQIGSADEIGDES